MSLQTQVVQYLQEVINSHYGTQYGSTPGGKVTIHDEGIESGVYYQKKYGESDRAEQAKIEVAAAKIYVLMGAKTVEPFTFGSGKTMSVLSKWNDSLVKIRKHEFADLTPEQQCQIGVIFITSILVKNWDAVGVRFDNLQIHRGTQDVHIVDTGSSFHHRSSGGEKPFDKNITHELNLLLDSNTPSGEAFRLVFKNDSCITKAIGKLKSIPDDKFRKVIDYVFDKPAEAKLAETLYVALIQRKQAIIDQESRILQAIKS